jgi:hypothetical protein
MAMSEASLTLDDLRLVALRQAEWMTFSAPFDHPCGRCGHDGDDHLVSNPEVSPDDPSQRFACSFPAKREGHAPVPLCVCPDFVSTEEARDG